MRSTTAMLTAIAFATIATPTIVESQMTSSLDGPRALSVAADGSAVLIVSFVPSKGSAVTALVRDAASGKLGFVDSMNYTSRGVEGMFGADNLTLSPDGAHCYLTNSAADALLLFNINPLTKELGFVQTLFDDKGGVVGLEGASSAAVSPDGDNVYVTSSIDDALVAFARDDSTGKLEFIEAHFDNLAGVDGLESARAAALSPDGATVYVAAHADNAVSVFDRDPSDGSVTYVEAKIDGVGPVTGLIGANSVAVSPDGQHVYVVGSTAVTAFDRNTSTGTLTFVEANTDNGGGNSIVLSPDGDHAYVASSGASSVAAFSRDAVTGQLTLVEVEVDGVSGVEGISNPGTVAVSPDGAHVYAAGQTGDAVAVFDRDSATGALTFVEAFFGTQPLVGRKLSIKNPQPGNPDRHKAVWIARDADVLIPEHLMDGDPMCNGQDQSTVTGTIRFFSDGSGGSTADTGPLPLPCGNWSQKRPSGVSFLVPKGYRYVDKELDEGPCKLISITHGKHVKAKCFGKGASTDFPYDLTEGVSEGAVHVVLTTGAATFCATMVPSAGRDGSDGREFQARESPRPTVCPPPIPSPGGAFVDFDRNFSQLLD